MRKTGIDEEMNKDGHEFVSVKEFHGLLLRNGIEVSLYVIYRWIKNGVIPKEKTQTTRKLKKNGYLINTSAIDDILAEAGNIEETER